MDDGAGSWSAILHSAQRSDQLGHVVAGTQDDDRRRHPPARAWQQRRQARLSRSWRSTTPSTKHLFDNRYGTGQSHARRHHPCHQRPASRGVSLVVAG
jgi:hypothetical protein